MYVVLIAIHINDRDYAPGDTVSDFELGPFVADLLAQKAIAPTGPAADQPEPEKEEPREPVL